MVRVAIGTRLQYRLQNLSQQPIYAVLIGIDGSGSAFAFQTADPLTEPVNSQPFEWVVQSPIGLTETHLICSRAPLQSNPDPLSRHL